MKRTFLVILIAGIFFSCTKQDNNAVIQLEGIYTGFFKYQGKNYWSSIEFSNDSYEEWPSGGAMYQKSFGCMSLGTYSIKESSIRFEADSFKSHIVYEVCGAMLLPGEYSVNYISIQDSIVFEKGTGVNRIVYYLGK